MKLEDAKSLQSVLTWWMTHKDYEFVKFVTITGPALYVGWGINRDIKENYKGTPKEEDYTVAPLSIRNCPWQMEDTDKDDFNHKPWVVFLSGTDDSNYGKRFNAKKDALKWAQKQDILDPVKQNMFWIN